MTICVQKTCHSALKQLVLRESYGAEIVNSMAVGGGGEESNIFPALYLYLSV